MTSLFCHLVPSIVTLCMRSPLGLTEKVQRDWPGYFPKSEDLEALPLHVVFLAGWIPYLIWFVLYSVWAICIGIHMPAKGYATVFDNLYTRMKLRPLMNKTGFYEYRSHCIIYLCAHFVLVTLSYFAALLFWTSYNAHRIWVLLLVLFCVWSGSEYFMNIDVKKFGPML